MPPDDSESPYRSQTLFDDVDSSHLKSGVTVVLNDPRPGSQTGIKTLRNTVVEGGLYCTGSNAEVAKLNIQNAHDRQRENDAREWQQNQQQPPPRTEPQAPHATPTRANAPSSMSTMFNTARGNLFTSSTFIMQTERMDAFELLGKAAAPSAFHSYVERPRPGKCYPNTRVKLLHRLEQWAKGMHLPSDLLNDLTQQDENTEGDGSAGWDSERDSDEEDRNVGRDCERASPSSQDEGANGLEKDNHESPDSCPILWLNGVAGAGKSAVAQTFAERCEDLGYVVASYIFSTTDPTRNTADRLVSSLAYQIARSEQAGRTHIEAVIHADPRVIYRDIRTQFASLLVNPIAKAIKDRGEGCSGRRFIVIIDGLDECAGADVQSGIICAIGDLLRSTSADPQHNLPLRFLISSRPVESITRALAFGGLQGSVASINLSTDGNYTRSDMVEDKFAEIETSRTPADSDVTREINRPIQSSSAESPSTQSEKQSGAHPHQPGSPSHSASDHTQARDSQVTRMQTIPTSATSMFTNAHIEALNGGTFVTNEITHFHVSDTTALPFMVIGIQAAAFSATQARYSNVPAISPPVTPPPLVIYLSQHYPTPYRDLQIALGPFAMWLIINWLKRRAIGYA